MHSAGALLISRTSFPPLFTLLFVSFFPSIYLSIQINGISNLFYSSSLCQTYVSSLPSFTYSPLSSSFVQL
jgi:hypothetical protein